MSTSQSIPGIRTGIWTNYDHGNIQGSTLTISNRKGDYLIAFLALYVSVAGSQLWAILRVALHQLNTSHAAQNLFHAQQQLVLRNSEGPLSTAYGIFLISWAWRKHLKTKSFLRSLRFILLALFVLAIVAVAGIFSSKVSKAAGSSVLIQSNQHCGYWQDRSEVPSDFIPIIYSQESQIKSASDYAQRCYGNKAGGLQCSLYVNQKLNWTVNVNATCPVDESLCILKGTKSLRLDTGIIDSNRDLGFNAPLENRVTYQKVTACAPIEIEQFTSFQNSYKTAPRANDTFGYYGLNKVNITDPN